jgi:NDP-sugar pyrophosphorylase family protein
LLERYVGDRCELILLDDVTDGQLCTVLAAGHFLEAEEDLLVMCSDTFMVSPLGEDIAERGSVCDGLISVFSAPGDRWSFAETDENGRVVKVAEKVRISDHASTGYYYFNNAPKFLELARQHVENEAKTLGEYFVMPVYQKYLELGCRVEISEATEVWDLGTPDALRLFERDGLAKHSLSTFGAI